LFSQISFNHSKLNVYDAGTVEGNCNGIDLGFGSSQTQPPPPPETSGTGGSPSTAGTFRLYIFFFIVKHDHL